MSKLPYVVFFLTLLAIAAATVWRYESLAPMNTPEVAIAKQQIQTAAAEPDVLPDIKPRAIAPQERLMLRKSASAGTLTTADVTTALAAQKQKNQTLARAANVIATSTATSAAAPLQNIKLYVQLGLTVVFLPVCLFFILSDRFNVTQKNFAYTTIGTILGFWFTTG
jgi:hypothetical protein